jgi:hypothetical protein
MLLLSRQAELNVKRQRKECNFHHSYLYRLPISHRDDNIAPFEGFIYLFVAYVTTFSNHVECIER